ncbi:formate/nitrite transporter family protein [Spiroplasma endosymbiont of Virgichneumon dumeticola]|uniref:formate/nitrite transporter family protein n=1 Tax=Spiroplasma endosymbiont of Virgichneumon dumeticola TaxID=3139323 RepID=UPI0035C8BE1A
MGLAAGLFIGIGYIGAIYATRGWTSSIPVGIKNLVFGMVFTIAITMIIFMGGELFTANSMMFLGAVKKQVKVNRLLLNLLIVLIGNFVGCGIISGFTALSGFCDDKDFLNNAISVFNHKLEMPWWQTFFSGIICNFLVAGSVYIAHSTKSSTAKFLLISLVIMVFALSGFSHVVANSYVWFLGPIFNLYGHNVSFSQFLQFGYQNQLPTLFGNFIGGGILLPGMYYIMYKKNLPNPITL